MPLAGADVRTGVNEPVSGSGAIADGVAGFLELILF